MKNILIVSHAMELGGAERALLGLLNSFDYSKYKVDLFLCRHEGELFNQIPKQVSILSTTKAKYLAIPMIDLVMKGEFKMLYGRLKAKIKAGKTIKRLGLKTDNQVNLNYSHKYTYRYFEFINPKVEYDLAISFLTPHYICLKKCNAKKRIAWIHTDYSIIDLDVESELEMWNSYDYIASISKKCTDAFLLRFPSLKNKIIRIDNIIEKNTIVKQSNLFKVSNEMSFRGIKLLSIGRFAYAKNFDNIPEICKRILESGLNIKWYIIGYGRRKSEIINKIQECNMQDHIIMLGKRENPYPYIKACDIYIQPSRYEGKAVTVKEAQILCKPVVITNFPTARSQLIDGLDGIIVPLDNERCAKGIIDFINNSFLRKEIVDFLNNQDYSNSNEIEKIYNLLDNYDMDDVLMNN
ncbi:glycosyltransferase [Thomasclavelia cocleata]|uniref:glycosyltransferase n=1 Tax=Thomasclavelia cocleata TaxID=69824 RepID=UPI00242C0957|nr:glycosyltransferase [Thomasclavelia cocleata]